MAIAKRLAKKYDISVGDKFYFNNYTTKRGQSLPDYLIITKIIRDISQQIAWIEASYENHAVYTKERMLSSSILDDSNLNPDAINPQWIFLKTM